MLIEGAVFSEILFQLTLFYLLALSVYKLLNQYVIPMLYSEINDIKHKKEDLKNKSKLLLSSKRRLENQIDKQGEKLFILEKKMQLWHKFVIENNGAIEKQNEILLKKIKGKREKQEENLITLKMEMVVIPRVIEETYNQIKKDYSNNKGLAILRELVEKIQPESK